MTRASVLLFYMLAICLLMACGSGSSPSKEVTNRDDDDTVEPPPDNSGPIRETFYLNSSITGITYPVSVYLPEGYDESDPQPYKVIYATDGQWSFGGYSNLIKTANRRLALVSIHQGPEQRRAVDYLLPGARDYFQFVVTELIPYVESRYNLSQEERSFAGESAGGMFVNTLMLLDDVANPMFKNLLSMDAPTMSIQPSEYNAAEEERYLASQELNVRLMLTGATLPASIPPFDNQVEQLYQLLLAREYSNLELIRRTYEVNHFNIGGPSFVTALELLFPIE